MIRAIKVMVDRNLLTHLRTIWFTMKLIPIRILFYLFNASPNYKKNTFALWIHKKKKTINGTKWKYMKVSKEMLRFSFIYGFVYIYALVSFAPITIWLLNASLPICHSLATLLHFKQQQIEIARACVRIFAAKMTSARKYFEKQLVFFPSKIHAISSFNKSEKSFQLSSIWIDTIVESPKINFYAV